MTAPQITGDVVLKPLSSVKPNSWNPNVMTEWEMDSLTHGFLTDGWLASHALLVWGRDDKGDWQGLIIDGEHRWTVANKLGMLEGPMVFLNGISEAQAKALTIKMGTKRGTFAPLPLAELIKSIQFDLGTDDMALDLGIPSDDLMKMLAEQPVLLPPPDNAPVMGASEIPIMTANPNLGTARMVQLFFNEEQHKEFQEWLKALSKQYKTDNITETVLEALRRAHAAQDTAA